MLDVEDYQPSKKNKYDEYVIEKTVVDENIVEVVEEDDEGESEGNGISAEESQ